MFACLSLAQCVAFSLVNCGAAQLKPIQYYMYVRYLLVLFNWTSYALHYWLEYNFNGDRLDHDAMAGHWCDTTWLHWFFLHQVARWICVWMYWWHCIKGNQSIEHIHNLFENTREFPYFSNWNRPCRWIQVVFQTRLISFKRMWYRTTIIWKHDTSVSPGVKTMYFHFLWCLPVCHTKRRKTIVYEKYMTCTYLL